MADVFEEVEEQIRSARYLSLVRQGWPYAAALAIIAILAVLGIWMYNRHQEAAEFRASETYAQGLQAAQKGDARGADDSFGQLTRGGPRGYQTLALMQEAGLRLKANKPAEAVRLLDEAAKVAPDQLMGDVARLKAATILMDQGSFAEVEQRLTPLIGEKRPLRPVARETLALARLGAGKLAAARSDFQVISLSQDSSEGARTRATYILSLIDSGTAAGLPAALKVAATLPPPPPAPLGPALANPSQPAPQAGAPQ